MTAWSVRHRDADGRRRTLEVAPRELEFLIEDSLGYRVNRAARAMAQQLADELRPAGVGIGQWAVLMFLWARDGMSQAELSRVVAIEPPTMVRTIDRMVRDGFVERRPDSTDARISRIHLTDRGRGLRDELIPKAVAVNKRMLARLSVSEGRALLRLLTKLAQADEATDPGPTRLPDR